jgi:hypothetical protein
MSAPDWDKYYCKHCARLYGWLPASKEYKTRNDKINMRYFTLCDTKAIDVFMLEMEKVLSRDENGMLPNVIICEGDTSKIPEILEVVRPPLKEAVIPETLENILTFEDDDSTRNFPEGEQPRDIRLRKKITLKRHYEFLKSYFPFDIINFDPCAGLLEPQPRKNGLYNALRRIFELQKRTERFLIFVTTPITDIAPESKTMLKDNFDNNLRHPSVKAALLESVKTIDYNKIEKIKRIAIGVAKAIIMKIAKENGWQCTHYGIYAYENENHNILLSLVVECFQYNDELGDSPYIQDVIKVISNMPKYYSYSESSSNRQVKSHLDKIVKFRNSQRLKDQNQ